MVSKQMQPEPLLSLVQFRLCVFVVVYVLKLELYSLEICNLIVKRLNEAPLKSNTHLLNYNPTNICNKFEKEKKKQQNISMRYY